MHPPPSSPQWVSGNMPAIILTIKKKKKKNSRFKNVPLFRAFGLVESMESWKCFLLLKERWFTIPIVEFNESKNSSFMLEVQCNKDYSMYINYCITWCTFMFSVRRCPGSFFCWFCRLSSSLTLRKINQAFLPVCTIVSRQNYTLGKSMKTLKNR